HDDRFCLSCYAAGVEGRKTETRSNRRRIVKVRARCPKADSLSGSFRIWSQGLLSCSPSSIGSLVDHGCVYMAISFGLLITRGSIPRSPAFAPIEYGIL